MLSIWVLLGWFWFWYTILFCPNRKMWDAFFEKRHSPIVMLPSTKDCEVLPTLVNPYTILPGQRFSTAVGSLTRASLKHTGPLRFLSPEGLDTELTTSILRRGGKGYSMKWSWDRKTLGPLRHSTPTMKSIQFLSLYANQSTYSHNYSLVSVTTNIKFSWTTPVTHLSLCNIK